MPKYQEAVDAIKLLNETGAASFITCESGIVPKVVCKFKTLKEAQAFHSALIECGRAAHFMELVKHEHQSRDSVEQ